MNNLIDNTRYILLVTIGITGLVFANFFTTKDVKASSPLDVNITNALELAFPETPLDVKATLEPYEDAFGRIRISDQQTLGDYKHVYFEDNRYINSTGNGGSVTHIQNESSVDISITSAVNSFAVHQTREYHHYQPGKSQSIKSTFVFGTPVPNVTRRSGLFDDDEGIYFEMAGSILSWNIRSITSGTPTLIQNSPRTDWLDPLDGTGPSGINLDFSKSQLLFIDFQWLGVGQVRCGFFHDGKAVLAKAFYHSNILVVPYLRSPSLPVRCELRGSGGNSGSMKQICATVVSEGGYAETGQDFSISAGNVGRPCPAAGTRYPILAIRLKNTFKTLANRVSVRLTNFTVYIENHGVLWEMWKLPSVTNLTGTVNWNDVNNMESAVEYSVHPTGINLTGAFQISSGFIPAGNQNAGNNATLVPDPLKAKRGILSQNFDSTDSEIFVITVTPLGTGNNTNTNAFASIQWREFY
jgi:hypothetical protein